MNREEREFAKMVEDYAKCEAERERELAIINKDRQRDKERADINWKFQHELQIDWERRNGFKEDAESPYRFGDWNQKYEEIHELYLKSHTYRYEVV